jgi:Tfp pilus assembly protein PilO
MKNKTTTILILSILVFLVSASGYALMLYSFNNLETELEGLYQTSANGKARLAELKRIEDNLKSTLAGRDRLALLFIKQEGIVDFISEIESTIKSLGLKGEIESVSEETTEELAVKEKENLNITLSASGSWNGVVKLVGLLEKLPYKATVDNVSLKYGEKKQESGNKPIVSAGPTWQISLSMHALVQKTATSSESEIPTEK